MKKLIQISIKLIQLLKKITNLLNELSFNSRPLSSNQSNIYNCKLNQSKKKSNRIFNYENNKSPNNILRKKVL